MKKLIVGIVVCAMIFGILGQTASAQPATAPTASKYANATVDNQIAGIKLLNKTLYGIWKDGDTRGRDIAFQLARISVNGTMSANFSTDYNAEIAAALAESNSARDNIKESLVQLNKNYSQMLGVDSSGGFVGNTGNTRLAKERTTYVSASSYAKGQSFVLEATGAIRSGLPFWQEVQLGIHQVLQIKSPAY